MASVPTDKRSIVVVFIALFVWCGKRDLNPYSVNYTPLKRARLPIPPLPHIGGYGEAFRSHI